MALPFLMLSAPAREAAFATAGGYRPGGAHRPVAAALSLAIAGGIGATLMLALVVPELTRGPTIITGTNIPVPQPDPDPLPDPQPLTQTPRTTITTTRPVIDVPRFTEAPVGDVITDPLPPTTFVPPDFGSGGGGTVVDPPRPPVFHPATRDQRFARDFQPAYPAAREREGIEGRCPVTVSIAPSGRVTGVTSNGCADELFFDATRRQALRSWRFRPATRDGVAVESTQDVAVSFRIDD